MRTVLLIAVISLCVLPGGGQAEDRCALQCASAYFQTFRSTELELAQAQSAEGVENDPGEGAPAAPAAGWGAGQLAGDDRQSGFPRLPGLRGVRGLTGVIGNLLATNPHLGGTWYADEAVSGQPARLGMNREFFQFNAPVWSGRNDAFVFSSHVQATNIRTSAILPTTHQAFPDQLWNIWIGGNYFHTFENGTVAAFLFDGGSASDKPFSAARNDSAAGTGLLILPDGDRNAWILGLQASTNSQVFYNLPIPGAAYLYNPNDELQTIVGFPYTAINYRFHPEWQFQFLYMFVTTVHARVAWQPARDWQLYVGFDWANENYSLAERANSGDRFYYYENRLLAGWQWWYAQHWAIELAGGYAFNRYFQEANESNFLGGGFNRVDVDPGAFVTLQIDCRF